MVTINGEKKYFDIIINTISPDLLFEQTYGELPFIGKIFIVLFYQWKNVFLKHFFYLFC